VVPLLVRSMVVMLRQLFNKSTRG